MKKIKYKYEAIDFLKNYIDSNYNGAVLLEEKSLILDNFIQNDFFLSDKNCSLVAMTRIIKYYCEPFNNIPYNSKDIYKEIYNIALHYGFNLRTGTPPTKIDYILSDYFEKIGIEIKSKDYYLPNFYKPIKKELDNNRPLIMNIAFGEYNNHSITITGYKIYKYKHMNIKFLEVYDGWKRTHSYIDYNVFAHNLFSINYYSINSLQIKKG